MSRTCRRRTDAERRLALVFFPVCARARRFRRWGYLRFLAGGLSTLLLLLVLLLLWLWGSRERRDRERTAAGVTRDEGPRRATGAKPASSAPAPQKKCAKMPSHLATAALIFRTA